MSDDAPYQPTDSLNGQAGYPVRFSQRPWSAEVALAEALEDDVEMRNKRQPIVYEFRVPKREKVLNPYTGS